jgi:integrase/recombinase XerD
MVIETDAGLWEVSRAMGHPSVEITQRMYVNDGPRAGIDHLHEYGPE